MIRPRSAAGRAESEETRSPGGRGNTGPLLPHASSGCAMPSATPAFPLLLFPFSKKT